jgi:hypothetical protein
VLIAAVSSSEYTRPGIQHIVNDPLCVEYNLAMTMEKVLDTNKKAHLYDFDMVGREDLPNQS